MSLHIPNAGASQEHRSTLRRKRTEESFKSETSIQAVRRQNGKEGVNLDVVYIGIAIAKSDQKTDELIIGITTHDATYSIDYEVYYYPPKSESNLEACNSSSSTVSVVDTSSTETSQTLNDHHDHASLTDFVVSVVDKYRLKNNYKIGGGGITKQTAELCPKLTSSLWRELDIVCFVFKPFGAEDEASEGTEFKVDEESDSVVRKAIEQFGPGNLPRLMVKHGNKVGVDVNGRAHITTLEDYQNSCHPSTWKVTMHFADSLKANKTKIAFFNSTPQGGGVALMRHALIRFLRLVGVKCEWYVPRPKSEVFRITKNNHNILQGVEKTGMRLEAEHMRILDEWCEQNADRYWTKKGGPLAARSAGGADVIIIDDPQMPKLVDIAKQNDPDRPVIFRSHIQVRADLADQQGTPTAGVWNWVWEHVQKCNVFVSHPVPDFVPQNVTRQKVGYMPATTDWLDGLNKQLSNWDLQYYMHEFTVDMLARQEPFHLAFPHRPYIVQIARFDPAKGIPDALASYALLRREYMSSYPLTSTPQLVIAGHSAIDDPDATPIYGQTIHLIRTLYPDLAPDIIVMRVSPTDQILNTLLCNATVALQLSSREGFEVKVSEALHAGIPVIATQRGGIPLQIQHARSGFLVDGPDVPRQVARYLYYLFTDDVAYADVATYAANHVSDEVGTVGNALCWMYLADTLVKGGRVEPEGRWIHDMAREEAGLPFDASCEQRLPRAKQMESSQGES